MRLAASCSSAKVWVPVPTLATKACNTSALNSVAPVMVMLLMGMGVVSPPTGVLGLTTPSCGKVTLLGGKTGRVDSASREMEPALGRFCACAPIDEMPIIKINRYFFIIHHLLFYLQQASLGL